MPPGLLCGWSEGLTLPLTLTLTLPRWSEGQGLGKEGQGMKTPL